MRAARRGPARIAAVAALAVAFALFAPATPAGAEILHAGNGIYTVDVDDATSQYTVTTGASHPLGEGLNVLFGDGTPYTSFDSLRSYTSGTDYKLFEIATKSTVPLGTSGFQTTYSLNEPEQPDDLRVVRTVRADGAGFADSRVEVTTVVTNTGTEPERIGLRYLWDYQVNEDDGPTFQPDGPPGSVLLTEAAFPSPAFGYYTIEDNDVSPAPPTFDVLGTVSGPPGSEAVAPTLLENVSWSEAQDTAFDYALVPGRVISVDGAGNENDNAVLYYWGDDEADAPTIAPGASYRVSASMYLTRPREGLPQEPPPPPPPSPPAPAAPTPAAPPSPTATIASGPDHETAAAGAAFTFGGAPGGSFECSLDGGRWTPCASGQAYSHLAPGDHLFRVREKLGGRTSAPASWRWTIDLPRRCVLRVARARVFVFARHDRARLVIHYTSWHPARVTVAYSLGGRRGKLRLGRARAHFRKAGVFRLAERLNRREMAKLRAAKRFTVRFKIPKTPHNCGRYYTKRLTIPRRISRQTVWFQADSRFAPGG